MPTRPPLHRPFSQRTKAEQGRDNDSRRGSARQRGYTVEWDKERTRFLAEHPLCLGCLALGHVVPALIVDHVEPHRGDMVKFWDRGMWQPTCRWHHDVVKKQLEAAFDRGELTVADLWLDSPTARRLTRRLRPALVAS